MRIPIDTKYRPTVLKLVVQTRGLCTVKVRVAHAYQPNTDFTDREMNVDGTQTFFVHMPETPQTVVAQVYNKKNGDLPKNADKSITVLSYDLLKLDTFPQIYDSGNPLIQEGLGFIGWFSLRAPMLSAGPVGSKYYSDQHRFRIDYMDAILDRRETIVGKDGKKHPNPRLGAVESTPARVSRDRGIIEWCKPKCVKYAQPYRFGITAHEIGHFYINENPRDEFEADENGIKMMIGKGYGYIDTANSFLTVFDGSPTPQNADRSQKVNALVDKLEKQYNRYH